MQKRKAIVGKDKDGKDVQTGVEWSSNKADKGEMECEVDIGCTYEKDIFAGVTVDLAEGQY